MKKDAISKYGNFFSRGLPSIKILIVLLIFSAFIFGIASVFLIHHDMLKNFLFYNVVNGIMVGIILIIIPTMLTIIFIKLAMQKISMKYVIFLAFVASITFSIFLLLGSILYIAFGVGIAVAMVIVGAASIFGWWFFVGKVLFSKTKKSMLFGLVQSTLYILFFMPASSFVFNVSTPLNVLLIKLYSGIFIFAIVIYAIILVFNKPTKKGLGVNGLDVFSSLLQDWVFGISTYTKFNKNYGKSVDIRTDTITFTDSNGIAAVLFVPGIHYGLLGNVGGSNFPYILEKYTNYKYKTTSFIMHSTVNEDLNPVSSVQLPKMKNAIDESIKKGEERNSGISYSYGKYGSAVIRRISFNNFSIFSFSRAPMVTEDISPEVSVLFRKLLERDENKEVVMIDTHNSRYETAGEKELGGVKLNSIYMDEYINAMKNIKMHHKARTVRIGVSKMELYTRLGHVKDLAEGNLNLIIFHFPDFKFGILQFNGNNMLPSLRQKIVDYAKEKYGIDMEVCTTDTHAVNSISVDASNVVGRYTKFNNLKPVLDECITDAIKNIEEVKVKHSKTIVKNFMVWGTNSRDRIITVVGSMISFAKILVPIIIVVGFIAAAWLIYII